MSWTVVGTGRMGSALCQWLAAAGEPPAAVVGRQEAAARQLARRFHLSRHEALAHWLQGLATAAPGRMLLAVPDDALPALAEAMARARADWRGACVLHTSGALPAAALRPLARRHAAIGSIHPVMTLPAAGRPAPPTRGLIVSVEGAPAARRQATALIKRWQAVALPLSAGAKSALHAAAALVGPGAVVQMAAAQAALAGLSPRARRLAVMALNRLLAATASNLEDCPPGNLAPAWTGPLARGDLGAVSRDRAHLPPGPVRQLFNAQVAAARRLLPTK
ncbi:MAG: DUF2520 domain-containing protein [Terriglobales bacterium]